MNLDALIHTASYTLAQEIHTQGKENAIQSSLYILCNDGIYAFILFAKKKKILSIIRDTCENLIAYLPESIQKRLTDPCAEQSANIQERFFTQDILQKTLTYTRYYLKTMGDNNEQGMV